MSAECRHVGRGAAGGNAANGMSCNGPLGKRLVGNETDPTCKVSAEVSPHKEDP